MTKTRSWLAAAFLLICLPVTVFAAPVIVSTGVWTDNRPPNDPFGIVGYNLALFAETSDLGGVPANISSVSARNLTTSETRSLSFDTADQFVNTGPYITFVPFNPAQLGVWQFSVTNLQGQVALQNSHNLDKPARLEFPTNIRVNLGSTTTQVTFDPVAGADLYNLTVYQRVGSALNGIQAFSSSTASFSLPSSLLTPGGQFVLRVRAADQDFTEPGGPIENRSVNAVEVSIPRTPIPTATPPLSSFPTADRVLFDVNPFVNQNLQLFSPESQTALTTPLTVDPNQLKLAAGAAARAIGASAFAWGVYSSLAQETSNEILAGLALAGAQLLPADRVASAFTFYLGALDVLRQAPQGVGACLTGSPGCAFFLMDANAYIWGDLVAPQLRIFANDPPDADFRSVVSVGIPTPGGLPTTGSAPLDQAFTALFDSTNRVGAFLQATDVSVDRYGTALAAGDAISAGLQLEAILHYLGMYAESANAARADLLALEGALSLGGFQDVVFDVARFRGLQDELRTSGFPPEVVAMLLQLGLGLEDVSLIRDGLVGIDPESLAGSLFGAIESIATAALPAAVPAPPTLWMITAGAAWLAWRCGRRGRSRRMGGR